MSPKPGETPTPKRGPGRPRKTPDLTTQSSSRDEIAAENYQRGYERGKEEGYHEGYAAAQQKNRPPLFEATRRWGRENAIELASYHSILEAEPLFAKFEESYGNEHLTQADRNLIFREAKRLVRKKVNLNEHGHELPAEAKRRLTREVKDFDEVVVS